MTDWTEPDINELLPGDPLTSAKALYMAQNPIALAEQATGAPKIANKITGGAGETIFSGLSTFGGVLVWGTLTGDAGGAATASIDISASINSSTYGAVQTVAAIQNDLSSGFHLFVDFSTGAWQSAYNDPDIATVPFENYDTGTLANTIGITHFKITPSTNCLASYLVMPQGGQSAS